MQNAEFIMQNAELNKKVVPYRICITSEFDKGQQSFVRVLFDLNGNCVVPIITHYSSLDDTQYVYNVELPFLILTICIF